MKILANQNLLRYNTFKINCTARYFAEAGSSAALMEILNDKKFSGMQTLVLGGGSNILFTGNYDGLVIKINLKGINVEKEDDDFFYVKAAAGEKWHEFVTYCVEHNYCGVENLSLIPGSVGAAPIQNIGAYGAELKDVFFSLEAMHVKSGEVRKFSAAECRFGYRDSIFKSELKEQYIIVAVTFILKKKPSFNTSYGAIEKELEKMGIKELSAAAISKAVCNIRKAKLPDPAAIGNAGSFFKNPVLPMEKFELLRKEFPKIPGYNDKTGFIKIPAGWLIEQCGWKGKRFGKCGVHRGHALVLVNYGGATGAEIFKLSEKIQNSVMEKFGVELEREVNVI